MAIAPIAVFAMLVASPVASAVPQQRPNMTASVVLQVPGGVLAFPRPGGAAAYQPRVFFGHGHINPTPSGYGYIYQWHNLSTGASGTITDRTPHRDAVRTGLGQIVMSGLYARNDIPLIAKSPSIGTFYVGH